MADSLAKQALKQDRIMEVAFSRAKAKAVIRNNIMTVWQKHWDEGKKGCHLYEIKPKVGGIKTIGKKLQRAVISRLRLGHTGLNKTMHLIGKHPSGLCECGLVEETVEYVICYCQKYKIQREKLRKELKKCGVGVLNLNSLFSFEEGK